MDNKTKVKVAVVIGIVILAVIFIFMVVFVKGNRPKKNKNIPTITNGYAETNKNTVVDSEKNEKPSTGEGESVTLDDVVSLAVKDGMLVKINSDLTSTNVAELGSGYSEFCYGESKAYISLDNEDGSYSIYEIDLLKNDYPQKLILTTSDYGTISNLKYYAGKLYFISQIGQLIEYSISEEHSRALTNQNEVGSFVIDKDKNILYASYKPNGENAGIYILDFTSNTFSQIIASGEELPKKVLFSGSSLVIDISANLYVYNTDTNSVVSIGADNYLSQPENQIAFYDNVLLYTDGASISLKDSSGNAYQDNWYTLNDRSIAEISMLDSKTIQIARFDENGTGKVTRSVLIDLTNGTTTEKTDSVYTEVLRIK